MENKQIVECFYNISKLTKIINVLSPLSSTRSDHRRYHRHHNYRRRYQHQDHISTIYLQRTNKIAYTILSRHFADLYQIRVSCKVP